jgi:hypothetical protein
MQVQPKMNLSLRMIVLLADTRAWVLRRVQRWHHICHEISKTRSDASLARACCAVADRRADNVSFRMETQFGKVRLEFETRY